MSWSMSGKITKSTAFSDLNSLNPSPTVIKEGAQNQIRIARETALDLLDTLEGQMFNVNLSGHCQADDLESAGDSIYISLSAIT